ncbi:MAG: carboxylating nicotinate-nucleotide diphosphorylase [Myxococcota bacterium]
MKQTHPWQTLALDHLIELAFREDLVGGDVTSDPLFLPDQCCTAHAMAKQGLVVCGMDVAQRVFTLLDPRTTWEAFVEDGMQVESGTRLFQVHGRAGPMLKAERIALNFMQHLSGIATQAQVFAQRVADLPVRIVDTRKTLPGFRALQRYAVRVGGCFNHRDNLGAGVLIKENHIRAAGSIARAVEQIRRQSPHLLKIEVEVTCLEELKQAITAGAEVVMLDNMSVEQLHKAVQYTRDTAPSILLEASGGVRLETLRAISETGVDIISVGSLTHSVQAADISLLFKDSTTETF